MWRIRVDGARVDIVMKMSVDIDCYIPFGFRSARCFGMYYRVTGSSYLSRSNLGQVAINTGRRLHLVARHTGLTFIHSSTCLTGTMPKQTEKEVRHSERLANKASSPAQVSQQRKNVASKQQTAGARQKKVRENRPRLEYYGFCK